MTRVLIAGLLFVLTTALAGSETLRIGISADLPPWESIDDTGHIIGFEPDIVNEVCRRIQAECVWSNQSFDGLVPSLLIGKYDLIVAAISITPDRSQRIDFSIPYADTPFRFAVAIASPLAQIKSREALEKALIGKKIGVQSGTTHAGAIDAHFKDAKIRLYERYEQIATDLIAGRIDAGLMDRPLLDSFIAFYNHKFTFAEPLFTGADYKELGDGIGIGIKKGKDALKNRVSHAIQEMTKDGTIRSLSEKYMGHDISYKASPQH